MIISRVEETLNSEEREQPEDLYVELISYISPRPQLTKVNRKYQKSTTPKVCCEGKILGIAKFNFTQFRR